MYSVSVKNFIVGWIEIFQDVYQEVACAAVHVVSHQFWRAAVSWDLSYLAHQGITYDAVDPIIQIATKTIWRITVVPEKGGGC